ncbi:MAG: cytochrome P450 [Acidimicrobiales bacterium]
MPRTALLSHLTGAAPPWTPRGLQDPYPWFTEALTGPSVVYDARADIWHVFRYDDVRSLLRDADVWSVAKRMERVPAEQRIIRLLMSDPPGHSTLRQHFSRAYRPRRVASIEARVREVAIELIDRALDVGTCDIIGDIAVPLTRTIIGDLIGVPGEDLEECARHAIKNPLGTVAEDEDGEYHVVIWMGAGEPENNRHFNEYFRDLIEERRRAPRDDLVSALAQMRLDDASDLSGHLNIGALLDEQFGAGQNTTVHVLGTMLATFAEQPDQLSQVRHDRALVPLAVEEALRYCAPLQARPRISTAPTTLAGNAIPEGAVALAWLQAANIDPREFDDPLKFDCARTHNPHVSFGFGEHYCLGAALARIEIRVMLVEWLDRVDEFHRVDPGAPLSWMPTYMLRGLNRLDLDVTAR